MTTGQKITALRKEKSISQETLAEKLNVSRQAISKWENDTAVPTTENLVRLSRIFDTNIDYFLTDKDCRETAKAAAPDIPATAAPQDKTTRTIRSLTAGLVIMAAAVLYLRYLYTTQINSLNKRIDQLNTRITRDITDMLHNIDRLNSSKDRELFDIVPVGYDLEKGTADIKVIYKPEIINTDDVVSIILENSYNTYTAQATLEGDRYVAVVHVDDVFPSCQVNVLTQSGNQILTTRTTVTVEPGRYILPQISCESLSMGRKNRKNTMDMEFLVDYLPDNPPTGRTYVVTDSTFTQTYAQGEIELPHGKATTYQRSHADGTSTERMMYKVSCTATVDTLPDDYIVSVTVFDSYGSGISDRLLDTYYHAED